MFVYALGLGLPFFLIGAFALSLPKSGPWMDTVKSVLGVALLALALVYLRDLFPATRALFPAAPGAVWLAAAAAAAGVLLGALEGDFTAGRGARRLAKGAGVALLAVAFPFALGAGAAQAGARASEGIAWMVNGEEEGLALARSEGSARW